MVSELGWGWDDVLPYFLRAEDNARGASEHHGVGGPLRVSDSLARTGLSQAFLDAAAARGLPASEDFNGPRQDGFGWYQLTTRDGRRGSTAVSYLHPVMDRPNLTVETHVHVHRVLFDGTRAVGVAGSRLSELLEFRAEREVIVSAGAYLSPQILWLSGIGRPDELALLQVPTVAEVPGVGLGLQDHPTAGCDLDLRGAGEPQGRARPRRTSRCGRPRRRPAVLQRRRVRRLPAHARRPRGPRRPVPHGLGHVRAGGPAARRPRTASRCRPAWSSRRAAARWRSSRPTRRPSPSSCTTTSPSPRTCARPWPACARCLEIARTEPLAQYAQIAHSAPASDSDADLEAHIRHTAQTIYHPTSTCRMGVDDLAVVDPELRVRGVEGLRVVDASIFPSVPRGNTNAPTIAVAEKAADLIRGRPAPTVADAQAHATA